MKTSPFISCVVYKETRKPKHLNPIYKRFKRQNFQIDFLEFRSIAKENKSFPYLLTIIDVYTEFAWAVPMPNKKSDTVLNAFKRLFTYF